jgi:hypothetical protein
MRNQQIKNMHLNMVSSANQSFPKTSNSFYNANESKHRILTSNPRKNRSSSSQGDRNNRLRSNSGTHSAMD